MQHKQFFTVGNMQSNMRIYVFKIEDKLVEIKEMSKYSAKVRAKRLAGAGISCDFIGVKGVEEWTQFATEFQN